MLVKKLCTVKLSEGNQYDGMILSEASMNPNGYFSVLVANLHEGTLKTVRCDYLTLVPDEETLNQ